jgi:hypothetical protein
LQANLSEKQPTRERQSCVWASQGKVAVEHVVPFPAQTRSAVEFQQKRRATTRLPPQRFSAAAVQKMPEQQYPESRSSYTVAPSRVEKKQGISKKGGAKKTRSD